MPAPITHIVFALKIINYFDKPPRKNIGAYIIGTSFPDIRYLGTLKREQTHMDSPKIYNTQPKNSFEFGIWLHNVLDILHEQCVNRFNLYELFNKSSPLVHAIKFAEDKYIYSLYSYWQELVQLFENIYSEELKYPTSKKEIKTWHLLITNYIKEEPSKEQLQQFVQGIGLDKNYTHKLLEEMDKLHNSKTFNLFLKEFMPCILQLLHKDKRLEDILGSGVLLVEDR